MSFLRTIKIINKIPLMMYRKILNHKHIFDIRRKEEGFDFLPDLIAISCVKEKASVSASVTVEAVLCVPLFLYAAVSLIWMLELRNIQSAVRCGLQSFAEIPVLNPISLHADLVNAVGKERMDRSMIVGGSGGVSCIKSWAIPGMGVLELTAEYEVELPVPIFHICDRNRDCISPELSVHLSGTVRAQCCENAVRGIEKQQWRNLSFV